ncbi:UNVERIFIED_CONTAM: serpin B [Acetivibrio alkalicellulosi]
MLKKLICVMVTLFMLSSFLLTVNVVGMEDYKSLSSIVYGDLNGDGHVNSADYILLKRYVLGIITEFTSEHGEIVADLNGDGVINSTDCVLLRRYILEMIDKFPVEQNSIVIGEGISEGFIDGNSRFAFNLFKQINEEDYDENVFISPFNISVALSMVCQGASTTTKNEIIQLLGFEGLDILQINQSYRYLLNHLNRSNEKIKINNSSSIWKNKLFGDSIDDDFTSVNQEIFDSFVASRYFTDESLLDEINNWISDATQGQIPEVLKEIDPFAMLYIISAIYFNGIWTEDFNIDNTIEHEFFMDDGSIKSVMMMNKISKMNYGEGNGYQAVRLPYGDGELSMYCILPDEDTPINDFIRDMDDNRWNEIKDSMFEQQVRLYLPRFKIEYGTRSIVEALQNMGMNSAFCQESADFSGISGMGPGTSPSISEVLHKAVVEVNEEGTEASAVTVIIITPPGLGGGGPIIPSFYANRPFIFVIADDESDTILFMGKYSNVQ